MRDLTPAESALMNEAVAEVLPTYLASEGVNADAAPIGSIARASSLRVRLARARYVHPEGPDRCPVN
ncbi:MAG: hypothetical protein AAGH92_06585 [Planctomycetota bacterium]